MQPAQFAFDHCGHREKRVDVGIGQSAPGQQLRAARDLARLLAERGERRQDADLLAPIYGGFTEGHETLDLIEAKALLDQMA